MRKSTPSTPAVAAKGTDLRGERRSRRHLTLCEPADERAELIAGLKRGDEAAAAELFERFHGHVTRLLSRLLGVDSETPDVMQDVFLRAFRNVHQLRSPEALTTWMTRITTFTAMDVLRHRSRRRWLRFVAPETLPDIDGDVVDDEGREAVRRTYRLLEKMPVRERVPFTLRKMCGLELTEVAKSCDCSLATVKRRIAAAEATFMAEARSDPILAPRLATMDGGGMR